MTTYAELDAERARMRMREPGCGSAEIIVRNQDDEIIGHKGLFWDDVRIAKGCIAGFAESMPDFTPDSKPGA